MLSPRRVLFLVLLLALALPSLAQAAIQPNYDLSTPDGSPFPSDRWNTVDWSQRIGLRVDLPKPDCIASGGATTIDPDGAGPLFETPLSVPPWEDLAYIP